jgi:hypothetical protein
MAVIAFLFAPDVSCSTASTVKVRVLVFTFLLSLLISPSRTLL